MNALEPLLFLVLCAPAATAAPQQQDPTPIATLRALASGLTLGSAHADASTTGGWTAARPDGHAPIGVMGDHVHHAGEWMFSLRAMRMHMQGMRDDQSGLSSAEVFSRGYMVTPTEMDMDMLMLGAMYAPTDDWTLTVMLPYLENSMDHLMGSGGRFTTESSGLGDVRLGGLMALHDGDGQRVHLNLGLSVPTGSTDERDDTPMMAGAKLPYAMQLGTGTFDLLPGLTYLGQGEPWSWGAQAVPRFHLGENDEGYRRGNRLDATGWLAHRLGDLSLSLRLNLAHWRNIHGADKDLNPAMVPTADPNRQGGTRLDALLGANYLLGDGALAGNRLAVEFGVPAFQHLDGPQLETDWIATLGWQLSL